MEEDEVGDVFGCFFVNPLILICFILVEGAAFKVDLLLGIVDDELEEIVERGTGGVFDLVGSSGNTLEPLFMLSRMSSARRPVRT